MANPTAEEQFLLELINEARLNPLANAARYISSYSPLTSSDGDIQTALTYFGVSGTALQSAYAALTAVNPVAWNSALNEAAATHSQAMIAAGVQSHQVAGEEALGPRIANAGYSYNTAGENIYAYSSGGLYAHAGFMVDWGAGPNGMQSPAGHRNNIMNAAFTEVGIDVTLESSTSNPLGPQVVTQDFGARANKFFLLGVAYNDTDGNKVYSVGEGVAGLVVSNADGVSFTTDAAGGYTVDMVTGKTFTLSGGGLSSAVTVTTLVNTANIKLDVVNGNTLLTSGSITIDSAVIAEIRGLGVRGLALTAGAGNQRIVGTDGSDVISGGAGNDVITPGKGDDTVDGGVGTDVVVYTGASSLYTVGGASGGLWTVTGNGVGADVLANVEVLRFSNGDFTYNRSIGQLVAYTGTPIGNTAPTVSVTTQAVTTSANTAKTVTVAASDPDGDALSFVAGTAAHGTITGGSGGVFTYTPHTAYTGPDKFTVTVNDGRGGTASQVVNITVNPIVVNAPPVVSATAPVVTTANTAKTVTITATDPDGDALTYTAGTALHGTVTGGSGGVFTYTPTTAYTGPDSFTVTVNDGKGHLVLQSVAITVNPIVTGNVAPTVATTQSVSTGQNTAKTVTVAASDPDGDTLTFSATAAAHGSVTGGSGGVFTYTPTAGYTGSDSFTVAVNDGHGHTVNQTVSVAISAPSGGGSSTPTFRLFTADGFAGEIGGAGRVLGSNGSEDIKLIATELGDITFDTSFNRGNDLVRFSGNASTYQIAKLNSAAVITDGTHSYTVPFGDIGTEIAFADGVRTLTFNVASGQLLIGNQVVGTAAAAIVAPSEGPGTAIEQLPAAIGLVYLGSGADVALGGKYSVIGTSGNEDVTYKYGDISLDASFNRGGDSLILPTGAANFSAYIVGSTVVLKSVLGSITVPWGDAGMALNFNGDIRSLHYDVATQKLLIGTQEITGTTANAATVLSGSAGGGGTGGGGTGGGGTGGGSELSADVGNPSAPVTLTLEGTKAYTLNDNAGTSNFAYVKGFNLGDVVHVTNATSFDYNFTTIDADRDGRYNDLEISFNDGANVNYMVLLDAISGSPAVFNEATAENAFGGNFITFG